MTEFDDANGGGGNGNRNGERNEGTRLNIPALQTGAFGVVSAPFGRTREVSLKGGRDLDEELRRIEDTRSKTVFAMVDRQVSNIYSGMSNLEDTPVLGFVFKVILDISFRFGALLVGVYNLAMLIPRIIVGAIPTGKGKTETSRQIKKAVSKMLEALELEEEGIFVFASVMMFILFAIISVFVFRVSPDAFGVLSNIVAFGTEQLKNLSGRLGG